MNRLTIIIALLGCALCTPNTGSMDIRVVAENRGWLLSWVSFQLETPLAPAPVNKEDVQEAIQQDAQEAVADIANKEDNKEASKDKKAKEDDKKKAATPATHKNVSSSVWKFYVWAKYYKHLMAGEYTVAYQVVNKNKEVVGQTFAPALEDKNDKKLTYGTTNLVGTCDAEETFESFKLDTVSFDKTAKKFTVFIKPICKKAAKKDVKKAIKKDVEKVEAEAEKIANDVEKEGENIVADKKEGDNGTRIIL